VRPVRAIPVVVVACVASFLGPPARPALFSEARADPLLSRGSTNAALRRFSWIAESNQASANFGTSVASAGDVNGDGYVDVIVGAPSYDYGQTDEGRVFLYYGTPGGLSHKPVWTAEGDQETAFFGFSVGTAGDVNGDGYDDVIVGAMGYWDGPQREGWAFVYYGSPTGPSQAWTAEGNLYDAEFGWSVGTAGDVNGDGFDDVVIGARVSYSVGKAFVYLGSAAGLSSTPQWVGKGTTQGGWYGSSVGTAGDVNGDGYDDVTVGEQGYSNGQVGEGRAFVYFGSPSGVSGAPGCSVESNQSGAAYGWSVGTARDVNGDGFDDLIVGSVPVLGSRR
jgi:FG-GAP repeat